MLIRQCTSRLITAINAVNAKTTTSVTVHSNNDRQQCADNLSISDSYQGKKLSPAHSSNIYVKSSKRRTQRTCHMNELKSNIQHNSAKTLPTFDIVMYAILSNIPIPGHIPSL